MSTRGYINFQKPYPYGWEDGSEGRTPITATILNGSYDGYLEMLNSWAVAVNSDLDDVVDVEANPEETASTSLTKLKVGDTIYGISGGSGGSTVSWNQIQTSTGGTKIAEVTIDNVTTNVYAPTDTGDSVSWSEVQTTGTKIATITINGTPTDVYAPSGGSGGSTVSWSEIQNTGTKIATITIDGTSTDVYAPTSGGASTLAGLSDVAISSATNGQILTYNNTTSKWGNSDIPLPYKEVTGTLSAGSTSITLSDAAITTSSTIEIYTDPIELDHNDVTTTTGSTTITFDAQSQNITVKVRVS